MARLRERADNMSASATALKKIADAADPLYKTLDDGQKRRLKILTHMEHRFDGGGWRHREFERGTGSRRTTGDRGNGQAPGPRPWRSGTALTGGTCAGQSQTTGKAAGIRRLFRHLGPLTGRENSTGLLDIAGSLC